MKKLFNSKVWHCHALKLRLKMKITILLTVLSLIHVQANTYSQTEKISLNMRNASVMEVLKEIESATEFNFLFNRSDVELDLKVSLEAKKKTVDVILSQLFEGTDMGYEIYDRQIILKKSSPDFIPGNQSAIASNSPPQLAVSGIVTDMNNVPLGGANVIEKGTTNGVVTDFDGRFEIQVKGSESVLSFSFIGFKSKNIVIGDNTLLNIQLEEDAQGLDEVVVVGYGSVKRADVTGAVSTVDSETITAIPTSDVQQALKGRSAGVRVVQNSGQPGSSVQIQIRGGNSYLGDNNPLYVVDGFPITGDISFLNPADIQTIDILKDASATAIYGSRGANGVVMITTKGGRKGQKGRIDLQSYYGSQHVIDRYEMMNTTQFVELANQQALNEGKSLPFDVNHMPILNTNWQDEIFRTAGIQSHTLSFSGGSDKSSYSVSANYFDQEGVIINSSLKRGSLRLSLNQDVNDWLRLSTNAVVTRTENNDANVNNGSGGGNNIFSAALAAPPTISPYDEQGNLNDVGIYPFSPVVINNPLAYASILDQQLSTKVLGNIALEFSFSEYLKFKVLGGTEQLFTEENYYSPSVIANRSPTGFARTSLLRNISYLNENILTYDRQIGKDDHISLVGGFTVQTFQSKYNQSSATGFANDDLQNNALGSGDTTLPNQSSITEWTLLSWLGRVNYSINDKYLFTASIRADGSSRFGENNKWGVFSSGAFAWKINNEEFLKNWDALSNLKLRIGYGETGSTAINPYQSLNSLQQARATFGNSDAIGFASLSAPNPDLRWETTSQLGIGLDVGFLNDKYRFTVDYYNKKTTDLLAIIPLPGSVGYSSQITNLGEVGNYGMEFSLGATIFQGEFTWDVLGQLSFNRNEVISIGEDILGGPLDIPFAAPINIAREGEPLGMFYGFLEDGYDDQGVIKYQDLNGDGEISNEDQQIIGNPYPDFIYGLNNTFHYKNIELNIFIEGSQGNDIFWATGAVVSNSLSEGGNQLADLSENYWTPDNTSALYPAPTSNRSQFRVSDRFIKDGSYLRLKNVRLAYNVPLSEIKIPIESLQVYVSGQNLFTLSNYPGLDPEVNTRSAKGDLRIGIDQTGYPSSKIITLGLNMQL